MHRTILHRWRTRMRSATAPLLPAVIGLTAVFAGTAHAQSIWTNPISDGNPSAYNPFTLGQTVAANLTVSGIGRGPGINANAGGDRYNATAWSTGALDANDYFHFTLTPASGYKLDLTSLTGTWQRSNTGPSQFALRSSLDNYATNLATGGPGSSAGPFSFSLSSTAFDAVTGPITFRLYGWGGSGASGTASVNDFIFNGAVVALPSITASVTSLAPFSTMQGSPSAEQTFTVAANGLTTPLVLTAPAGFELRQAGTGAFGQELSFNGPSVTTRTVEVRLAGTEAGVFNGAVQCTSTGATTRTVNVEGTVLELRTQVSLAPATLGVLENEGSFQLTASLINASSDQATTADLVLLSGDPARIGGFTSQTITFPAGSEEAIIVPITITDNGHWDTGAELVFALTNISGGIDAEGGVNITSAITIADHLTYGLLINELDYAMAGSPDKFIELKNTGATALDLAAFKLLFLYDDGSGATAYDSIILPSVILAAGDYFVIAGSGGMVAGTDLGGQAAVDNLFSGGGLALAIALHAPDDLMIDALSYEGDVAGHGTGGGTELVDPADVDGVSLARVPDGQDTNTASDWRAACPTPGAPNSTPGSTCDDGDPDTVLDLVQADCSCAGTAAPTVDCEGVEGGNAMPGTACDDNDPETLDDTWTLDCACAGTPVVRDCLGVIDGPAMPGTPCDDLNGYTTGDMWTAACDCAGTLIPTAPVVTTDSASAVTALSAVLHGTVPDVGSSGLLTLGFEYATTAGFAPGTGTVVSADAVAPGAFVASLSGLLPFTTYHFIAFATNNEGQTYGSPVSLTTGQLDAPLATDGTAVSATAFTANWEPVDGATGYRLDVSTSPTFGTVNTTSDLFISEYVEGSGNNKYLEIFNGTGVPVDLSDYRLSLYSNGGTVPNPTFNQEVVLSGTIANGEVVVYKHPSATIYGGTATSFPSNGPINYNGDDALGLFRLSTNSYVDIFGRIGEDPGTAWTASGLSTLDRTLVRKSSVLGGVTVNPTSGFPTLASEWNGLAMDNVSGLGSHAFTTYVPDFVAGYQDLAVAGTSHEVTGLTSGITYYFRVRAVGGNSTSLHSNVIEVVTGENDCEGVFNGPAIPGTACDDGNAATINDVYGADCICLGEPAPPEDCLGVENGPAMPGTPCDDDDAYTTNDAWTLECTCTGLFQPTTPTVVTLAASDITATAARIHATISSDGSSAVTDHGFEWSTTPGFSPGTGATIAADALVDGAFDALLGDLAPGTTVHYIAFATNNEGTGYGDELSFSTAAIGVPLATAATSIDASSFIANWDAVEFATGYLLDVSTSPTFTGAVPAADLFLSEYVEGSSNNKYLEVFNGTGTSVDLSDYQLLLFANGATTPTNTVGLSGTLADGTTVVYRNSGAALFGGTTISSAATNFNGDDAVALRRISTDSYVDILGSIGNDPGSAWTAPGLSTVDRTLVRKATVSAGLTVNPAASFPTLATEWDGFAQDDVSHLGQHTYSGEGPSFLIGYADLPVTGTSQLVTGLQPGSTYYYRVRAVVDAFTSENSNTIDVTTMQPTGCTDPLAENHDPDATQDDGSCLYCAATITHDTAIPTPIQIGTGLPADHAAVSIDCHPITIGVAAFERFVGAIVPTNDVYRVAMGNSPTSGSDPTPAEGLARWNYLLSVDLGTFDFTQVQVLLDVDLDPAAEPVWNTLDLSALLIAQENGDTSLFQAAENLGFPFWQTFFPGATFDPHAVGTYNVRVRALSATTSALLAELPITVEVFCPDSDNDGATDCEDECPNDPDKVLAGACGCGVEDVAITYYADLDGDGFGDINAPLAGFTCEVPDGHVANSTDDCPVVPGVIGAACDDGDPATANDVLGADCVCNGVPVVPVCTGHEVTLTIAIDGAASGQVTWSVVDLSGAPIIEGGPYDATLADTVVSTICLPLDPMAVGGLRLFNDADAGLGASGFWEVRDAAGDVVVRDAFTSGAVSPALATASPGYGTYHELGLPLGDARIAAVSCGRLGLLRQDRVFADAVPGVSTYQFQFADPDAGFRRRIAVPRNWVRIAEMVTLPLQAGTTYLTTVRVDRGVAGFADDAFGAGCELGLTAETHCTGLIDNPGANSHSCGVTRPFGGSAKLWANPVTGASTYRFRFTHAATGFVRTIDRTTYLCALNWVTLPLLDGLSYDVDVQVFVNGAWTGYCGPVCPLTIGAVNNAPAMVVIEDTHGEASLMLWPNPNSDGRVHLLVEGLSGEVAEHPITVFDAQGQLVFSTVLTGLATGERAVLDLAGLPAGIYILRLSEHERTFTTRLVMER